MYCGLQNNRPEDDKSIPENLFMSRKDPEQTPEKDLPADLFGRRKIFTVFSGSFRIFGNLFTVFWAKSFCNPQYIAVNHPWI